MTKTLYKNRLYYPWGREPDKLRENIPGHLCSYSHSTMKPYLHGCCSQKTQAMSAAISAFSLYQARFSVIHPKLLWTHWKSRGTFCTHRIKTFHLDARAPITSRMQELSSHPLTLQVMFSLIQQDPPRQESSARRGDSCDLALVMDLPELITQSCRALLRCSHLLPNCWSWNQTPALNTT